MHAVSLKVKLIAIFLVAFVCLNAGGAVCVAYCRTAVEAIVASADHCPLQKKAGHCDPQQADPQPAPAANAVGGDKLDCCSMTLSFIGAPIEKRTFSYETAELSPAAETDFIPAALFRNSGRNFTPVYRRPPPLDRRIERIKHCVIRI